MRVGGWGRGVRFLLFLPFVCLSAAPLSAGDVSAYLSPEQRRSIADYLRTAPIVDDQPIPVGYSRARKLTFPNGLSGVFKADAPDLVFFDYRKEIIAYAVDELLGLDLVPVTVERLHRGQRGSLQLFIEGARVGERELHESYPAEYWRLFLLDYLVDNRDRCRVNYLLGPGDRLIAIDHGLNQERPDPPAFLQFPPELRPRGAILSRLWALDAAVLRERVTTEPPPGYLEHIVERRRRYLEGFGLTRAEDCAPLLAAELR